MQEVQTQAQSNRKVVNVIGWYGHKNIGDEAFQDIFKKIIPEDYEIKFTEKPDLTADAIILGGGGVVRDSYLEGLENYAGPIYALGVDIAVNGQKWDRLKSIPFKHLYVRSNEYVQIAQKEADNISYCPDITFLYDEEKPPFKKCEKKRIGLILSCDISAHTTIPLHIANTIKALTDVYPTLIVMPFFTAPESDDPAINATIASLCDRSFNYIIPKTPSEAINEISKLDFLITMRFHGAIFATITGTPFVALANKGKCSLYCEQEHLYEHFVELSEANDVKLLNRISYISSQPNVQDKLLNIAAKNRDILKKLSVLQTP
jgi:polysaccharide pyruvyl transferase WcaK-like protein